MPIRFDNPLGTQQRPTFVQAEQQMVWDEVLVTLPGGAVGVARSLFDKDTVTTVVFTGNVIVDLKYPILINHVAVSGNLVNVTISVRDLTGATTVIGAAVTAAGWSSGAIDPPILANRITFASVGASTFTELTILKVIATLSTALIEESEYVEFVGQKVYWDPLDSNTGGAPALQYHMLTRVPLETDADDVPGIDVDREVATITNDAADAQRLNVYFHEFTKNVHEIRSMAKARVTVEMSANARCTSIRSRIHRKNITTNVLTAVTAEKTVTITQDGAAIRHVNIEHQDFTTVNLSPDEVLVWQVRIFGRQVAANVIPSFLMLLFRRGTFDCKMETEIVALGEEA